MGAKNFAICRICGKERGTKKERNGPRVMIEHNRWDERLGKMVHCLGSEKKPWDSAAPAVVFRRA